LCGGAWNFWKRAEATTVRLLQQGAQGVSAGGVTGKGVLLKTAKSNHRVPAVPASFSLLWAGGTRPPVARTCFGGLGACPNLAGDQPARAQRKKCAILKDGLPQPQEKRREGSRACEESLCEASARAPDQHDWLRFGAKYPGSIWRAGLSMKIFELNLNNENTLLDAQRAPTAEGSAACLMEAGRGAATPTLKRD